MEMVRFWRWPSPSWTEMAASLASSIVRSAPARSRSASELGSASLLSRARRSLKVRRRPSSSLLIMPSVMAWAMLCFHPSSRTSSMSSSVAWECGATSERDCRRLASLKEWSAAAWWVSLYSWWSRWKTPDSHCRRRSSLGQQQHGVPPLPFPWRRRQNHPPA